MSYVTFLGVGQLDELYVEATHKMKCDRMILQASGEEKRVIEEATSWIKLNEGATKIDNNGHNENHTLDPSDNNTIWWCDYDMWIFMRIVIVW